MAIRHSITLSTSEPNNEVGNLKIRQGDEQTQTLVANITENGVPKPFVGLQPFFCAKLGQTAGLGIIEQKVTGTMNPANGTLEYVMRPEDWQKVGRQIGYFAFRKMKNDHEWTEQFTTRDFTYNVIPSVTGEIREVKKDGSTYVWTIEDMLRLFKEYMATGKIDWENYKNDERTIWETYRLAEKINWDDYKLREKNEWKNYKDDEKITWEKFVEDNREFLENADPGGKIILELLGGRGEFDSLGERLDSDKAEVNAQLAETMTNVKNFGAKGDGNTDDSVAIQQALDFAYASGSKKCYIPKGEYMVNKTLIIPSRVSLFGDGIGNSILKAKDGTVFDDYAPMEWDGMPEKYYYKPLLRTDESSKNIKITRITIDYNSLVTGDKSPAPLMVAHTRYAVIDEIEIKNGIEPGWILDNDYGDRNRGCNILFAFAENCSCKNSIFNSAEYESISIRFASNNIDFSNNVVHAVYNSAHALQTAIPLATGLPKTKKIKICDNVMYIQHPQDAIACHHSDEVTISGNTVILMDNPNRRVRAGIRMVDNNQRITIKDNIVDMTSWDKPQPLSGIILDEGETPQNGHKVSITVANNTVKMKYVDGEYPTSEIIKKRPIIGALLGSLIAGVVIEANQIYIEDYPEQPLIVIGVYGNNWTVVNNIIWINEGPNHTPLNNGPIAIYVKPSRRLIVSGNSLAGASSGRFTTGLYIEADVYQALVSNNSLEHKIYGESIVNLSPEGVKLSNNLGDHTTKLKGALLHKNTNQLIGGNGANQVVNFEVTAYDTYNFVDVNKFVIPKGVKRVKVSANVRWESNNQGYREIRISQNGDITPGMPRDRRGGFDSTGAFIATAAVSVSEGDYFELRAVQNSGVELNLVGTKECWFSIEAVELV